MELQRREHLNARPYERSEERNGYANGFKAKHIKTRVGELSLKVPQVRDSSFYPSAIERGMRSERALKLAVAEMYVQGVATRRVKAITEELCGFEVSSGIANARLFSYFFKRPVRLGQCLGNYRFFCF